MSDYKTLVVPYDFSEHARAALSAASDLARRLDAQLHLVHVIQAPIYASAYGMSVPPQVDLAELHESVEKSLKDVAEGIEGLQHPAKVHVVEDTQIASAICEFAEEIEADLIVMGTHGRSGLAHVFLGSAAERTLRLAPCPVLTLKAPDSDTLASA